MLKKIVLSFFFSIVAVPFVARAEIILRDDFSTNGLLVGSTPDVGLVWTQIVGQTLSPLTVASGSINMAGGGSFEDATANFVTALPKVNGNSILSTFSINVTAATAGGDYFFALNNGGSFFSRVFARSSANAGFFNLGVIGSAGTVTYGTDLALNTPTAVEVGLNFVPGATNDVFNVAVNSAPYLSSAIWGTTTEPTQFTGATLRQAAAANAPTLAFSNLTVDSVTAVPEPTSMALLGMVGVAGMAVRYRRKNASLSAAV
jgi:hypothetical protein